MAHNSSFVDAAHKSLNSAGIRGLPQPRPTPFRLASPVMGGLSVMMQDKRTQQAKQRRSKRTRLVLEKSVHSRRQNEGKSGLTWQLLG